MLWEAFRFADRLGEYFRDFAAFKEDIVPLLRNPEVVTLRAGLLDRLRNQAVYHHDDEVIPAGLNLMHGAEYVLLSTRGTTRRETYYDLADIAVMHFALPPVRTVDEFLFELSNALQSIARISSAFAAAADRLILEYAKSASWTHRAGPKS